MLAYIKPACRGVLRAEGTAQPAHESIMPVIIRSERTVFIHFLLDMVIAVIMRTNTIAKVEGICKLRIEN